MLHQPTNKHFAVDEIQALPSVSVIGLGYVGAVSTACLASLGHRVVGVDIDPDKVKDISSGVSPIHENDLGQLLSSGVSAGLISATTELADAVVETDITFVSVGTPTSADGGCDDRFIRQAARDIGRGLKAKAEWHLIVMRCSIPPGATRDVMVPEIESASGLKAGKDFGVCFNPEFLREGVAIADFHNPPKTVIGAIDARAADALAALYSPVDSKPIITTIEVAEMVKYVDNVWHAVKVTFGNEIGRLCKRLDVDSHDVMDVFVQDTKLNLSAYYLKPGFAYGGSCLPKEVRAVCHIANEVGAELPMIQGLDKSNQRQIEEALTMVRDTGADKVAVLGLAFKPETDDLRESPVLEVISALIESGIEVEAHDPAVTQDTNISSQLSYVAHGSKGLGRVAEVLPNLIASNPEDAINNADAVIVTHSNSMYRELLAQQDRPVIDVARLWANRKAQPACVDGISW